MSFAMFVTWVLVGLSAGLLAGVVMRRGGYGLKRDIILGLVGSVGANVILRTLGVLTGAGIFVVAVVALIGAAIPIVAQRKFWPTESAGEEKAVITVWRWGLAAAGAGGVVGVILGPSPQPAATAGGGGGKTDTRGPAAVKGEGGGVTGGGAGTEGLE